MNDADTKYKYRKFICSNLSFDLLNLSVAFRRADLLNLSPAFRSAELLNLSPALRCADLLNLSPALRCADLLNLSPAFRRADFSKSRPPKRQMLDLLKKLSALLLLRIFSKSGNAIAPSHI